MSKGEWKRRKYDKPLKWWGYKVKGTFRHGIVVMKYFNDTELDMARISPRVERVFDPVSAWRKNDAKILFQAIVDGATKEELEEIERERYNMIYNEGKPRERRLPTKKNDIEGEI